MKNQGSILFSSSLIISQLRKSSVLSLFTFTSIYYQCFGILEFLSRILMLYWISIPPSSTHFNYFVYCLLLGPPQKPYEFAMLVQLWSQAEDLVPTVPNITRVHFKMFKLCEPQLLIHRLELIITICEN